ncbi:YvcK family protein [Candidatus Saccharibacteria bacterium CPR2]|nr:YvcK family protein [Candidatus Saccharibacteria bacterium CPR2]
MSVNQPEITVIGGGTGSFTLLQELKEFTPNISAIVNMCDDGGSTGVLRDELGVLPPGDVRQCLVALSDTPEVRDLFSYRFDRGRFESQSLGNIILSGLELQHGSFAKAVKVASAILHITGQVIPATLENHTLVMQDGDETVRGEYIIGHREIKNPEVTIKLDPPANINPEAAQAIEKSDLVVIAPGNLYGSLLPVMVVDGLKEALEASRAKKIAISNLVNKPGQTDGWHVADYVKAFEQRIGKDQIDYALYNNEPPSKELLEKYAAEGEFPVDTNPERFSEIGAITIGASLVAKELALQDPNDKVIRRTLIRHDAYQVGRQLMRIFYE